MPPKRGSRNLHSRSSSSTKVSALAGLQFTQKDSAPAKKNGHIPEPPPRQHSQAKLGRTHSREQVAPPLGPLKRRSSSQGHTKAQKVDFTISTSADDDSEWVSSESGAATPLADADDSEDDVPPPKRQANIGEVSAALGSNNAESGAHAGTPRAIPPPPIPRVESARRLVTTTEAPSIQAKKATPGPVAAPSPVKEQPPIPSAVPAAAATTQVRTQAPSRPPMHLTKTDPPKERSKTPPPTSRPRDPDIEDRRLSMTRPPSTRSVKSKSELRPHPLIRGHSFGPYKPSMAPLTTVTSDSARAEIASNPPSMSSSPTSAYHVPSLRSPLNPNAPPSLNHQLRRSSISSARSVATLPSQSIAPLRATHDRHRTFSTMSTSASSSAALSSLAHLPMNSRPATPPYLVLFPQPSYPANLDSIHPLLSSSNRLPHFTVLASRNPLRESYDRVIRAKQSR